MKCDLLVQACDGVITEPNICVVWFRVTCSCRLGRVQQLSQEVVSPSTRHGHQPLLSALDDAVYSASHLFLHSFLKNTVCPSGPEAMMRKRTRTLILPITWTGLHAVCASRS